MTRACSTPITLIPQVLYSTIVERRCPFAEMGCNGSKRSPVSPGHDTNEQEDLSVAGPAREESQHPAFKLEKVSFAEEDGLQFDEDHPGYLELRQILDDPIGQKYLGTFMRQMHQHEALFCWLDIHEYVSIPTRDYRRCMAKHIYEKVALLLILPSAL